MAELRTFEGIGAWLAVVIVLGMDRGFLAVPEELASAPDRGDCEGIGLSSNAGAEMRGSVAAPAFVAVGAEGYRSEDFVTTSGTPISSPEPPEVLGIACPRMLGEHNVNMVNANRDMLFGKRWNSLTNLELPFFIR